MRTLRMVPRDGTGDIQARPRRVGLRARLYDARGDDQDIELSAAAVRRLKRDTLLWVDVEGPSAAELRALESSFDLPPPIMQALAAGNEMARLVRGPDWILMTVQSVEPRDEGGGAGHGWTSLPVETSS